MSADQKNKPVPYWWPNSTQVPNKLLDEVMPHVSEAVTKVILVVCRKTFGFQKPWDKLSVTQFVTLTGMSDRSVEAALSVLVKSTLLRRGEMTAFGWEYCLNLDCDMKEVLQILRVKERKPYERRQRSGQVDNEINSGGREKISPRNRFGEGGETNSQNEELISPTKQTPTKPIVKTKLSPEATVDPRRKAFIECLKKYREHLSGSGSFQPTAKDLRNLDVLLREHPKLTEDIFKICLTHRAQSVKAGHVNAAEEIHRWIGRILEFSEGPLDRYGKPLQNKGGKHGTTKAETITTNINEALERRAARRVAGSEVGEPSGDATGSAVVG